jgi:class 3 adenylate cyclase
LKESAGYIRQYDEALTSSASLSVWTGDTKYVTRYNDFVPLLTDRINLVLSLVPPSVAANFAQTDTANNALIEMETIALDACTSGNLTIGRDALASAAYTGNKTIYANGILYLNQYADDMQVTIQNVTIILNIIITIITTIVAPALLIGGTYLIQRRNAKYIQREKDQADKILGSILPQDIVGRLKQGETKIADAHQDVALMFTDIVGFTPLSSVMSVVDIVELLNNMFSAFDSYARQLNIEKIKTIGDGYMCVDFNCNSENMIRFANKCLKHVKMLNTKLKLPSPLNIRLGMHTGPVISGIIGSSKIAFDVWGDSVNVASRMESSSEPGHLQLSSAAYDKISHISQLRFMEREIQVKGKGQQFAYLLLNDEEGVNK